MSDACSKRVTASTGACCALGPRRLKVDGSERSDAVSEPPRAAPDAAAAVALDGAGTDVLHANAVSSAQAITELQNCRATLEPTGQLLGRLPNTRIYGRSEG